MEVVEIEAKESNFGFLRADQEHSMNTNVYGFLLHPQQW